MKRYDDLHRHSLQHAEAFWAEAAEAIDWHKRWTRVLDGSDAPFYRWFTGGELNTCYNAVDRHVENGRADQAAIIYDSPATDTKRTISYRALRDDVARFAGILADNGIGKGET